MSVFLPMYPSRLEHWLTPPGSSINNVFIEMNGLIGDCRRKGPKVAGPVVKSQSNSLTDGAEYVTLTKVFA